MASNIAEAILASLNARTQGYLQAGRSIAQSKEEGYAGLGAGLAKGIEEFGSVYKEKQGEDEEKNVNEALAGHLASGGTIDNADKTIAAVPVKTERGARAKLSLALKIDELRQSHAAQAASIAAEKARMDLYSLQKQAEQRKLAREQEEQQAVEEAAQPETSFDLNMGATGRPEPGAEPQNVPKLGELTLKAPTPEEFVGRIIRSGKISLQQLAPLMGVLAENRRQKADEENARKWAAADERNRLDMERRDAETRRKEQAQKDEFEARMKLEWFKAREQAGVDATEDAWKRDIANRDLAMRDRHFQQKLSEDARQANRRMDEMENDLRVRFYDTSLQSRLGMLRTMYSETFDPDQRKAILDEYSRIVTEAKKFMPVMTPKGEGGMEGMSEEQLQQLLVQLAGQLKTPQLQEK